MQTNGPNSTVPPDLIRDLRQRVRPGVTIRELVGIVHSRLGCKNDEYLPVLSAFVHAFHVPLRKILPIREWIGSNNDAAIDAQLLPEIEKTRSYWAKETVTPT